MKKVFKCLSYAIIYLLISLASAYGVITVSINNSNKFSSKGDNPVKPVSPSIPTQITKVLDNFSNSKFLSLNLTANMQTSFENFNIIVDANIDLAEGINNIKAEGSILASTQSNNQYYNIDFAYQNGTAYFDLFNGKLSIDTKNIIKPINQILQLLEIELPDISGMLGEMDLNAILGLFSNLTEEMEENDPETINLLITIPVIEQVLTLKCDKDYKAKALNFGYNAENIAVDVKASIAYPEQIYITNKNEKDYVNVNNLLDIATGAINYFKTEEKFAVNINAKYEEFNITGEAYYNPQQYESKLSVNIKDKIVNLILKNNFIYLEFENVYLKFNLNDYALVCDFIEDCFGIKLPIDDIINLLKDFNKDELIDKLAQLGFDLSNIKSFDLSILEKVFIENNKTNILLKNIGLISIGLDNDKLSSIGFIGQNADININTINYKNFDLNVDESNYINIVDLLPTLQNAINILNGNSINGTINLEFKDYSLPIDFILSLDNNYLKLSTWLENYQLTIEKLNDKIYINFADKFKAVINLENIFDEIIDFLSNINYDIDLSGITSAIKDLGGIFKPDSAPLLIKGLVKTENGIVITLFNDLVLDIENGSKQINVSSKFNDLSFNATVIASDTIVNIPVFNDDEYTKIEDVLDLAKVIINSGIIQAVEGSVNYLMQKTIAFDFDVNYDKIDVNGKIFIDIENLKLYLNANYAKENFNILLEKNIVYLEYKNIFVKFDIFECPTVLEMLNSEFGFNLPVELISKLLNAVESGNIENVVDTIKGEFDIDINLDEIKFDISQIDKDFFENIVVDGNKTIIPLGDKTITLEVIDKMLTNIQFNGFGISINAKTIEYVDNALKTNKENYINIIDVLPTLQNVLDIMKADTISGNFNISNKNLDLTFNYTISKSENLYAEITTTIYQLPIKISYLDNKLYLNADNKLMLVSEISNLAQTIDQFIKDINLNINIDKNEICEELIDVILGIVDPNINPLLIKGLVKTENGIVITLFNDLVLDIENGSKQINVSSKFNDLSFNATVIASDTIVNIPVFNDDEYTKIEDVLDLAKVIINSGIIQAVEGSVNYLMQKTIAFDFDVNYDKIDVNGKIFIDIENLKLYLNANYAKENFNILLEKNIVYLEYKNIFVKFDIFECPTVLEMLNSEFGFNLPVELISKLLNAVESGNIENVVDTIKGEFDIDINLDEIKFDISQIDKDFFENIVVDGNKTIIPLGDKTITLEVIDKMLTNIQFNGFGISINAKTIEYVDNALKTNKENYINIIDVLPTLQNVLDIMKADTISGNFNIKSKALEIPVAFNIDKAENLYAEFNALIYQGPISIYYENNKVYINIFNQIKLVSDLNELPKAIEELTDGLDTLIDPILDLIGISKAVVDSFENDDKVNPLFSSFKQTENGLEFIINGINVNLTNNKQEILIFVNIDEMKIEGSIKGSFDPIERMTFGDDYVNIEEIFRLVNAAKNMSKREDFHVNGFIDLKLGSLALDTVEFDIYIKVVEKKLQLILEFPNIPTIPFVTKGLFENVKNRSTKIYFIDDDIYMFRQETKDNKLRQQTVKLTSNSLMNDIYTYIQFAFGFTDTIMDQIKKPAEKYREGDTINLNNVLSGFSIKENADNTQTIYNLTLNIAEIADNKVLGKLGLRLYVGENEIGETYLQALGMNMSILDGFVNLATPLKDNQDDKAKIIKIVDYGKNIDYKMQELYDYDNAYTFAYDTMMEKIGDGEWKKTSEILRTITFVSNSEVEVAPIIAPFKTQISIPTLDTIVKNDGIEKTTMTFIGWFTSENFEEDSLFTNTTMPQNDVTLFAKWNIETLRYSTINFVTFIDTSIENITLLEGEKLILPSLKAYQVVAEDGKTVSTYSFTGWYLDEDFNEKFNLAVMPKSDTTLYANWILESVEHSFKFNLYDNGNVIYSVYLAAGKNIDLSGVDMVNENTKFYLDENYMDEFNSSLIMPEYDLSLHIRNKYTLSIKSEYGNIEDSIIEYWQGQSLSVASQEDYYIDDGSQTQRDYYYFKGFSVNGIITERPSVMPNENVEIIAIWENETKYYYNVSFVLDWYIVYGCVDGSAITKAPTPMPSIKVLDGTILDLSQPEYRPTCEATTNALGKGKLFTATSWGTSAWKKFTKADSGFTSITITQDTTLYACWKQN